MKWPNGPVLPEDVSRLESMAYGDMKLDDKLAYIFTRFGKIETPTEDNTSMRSADAKIQAAFDENDKVFEMMWYLSKEDALLKAVCKIWKRYYDKRSDIARFKNKIYKMRKQAEWEKKQEEKKKAWEKKQADKRKFKSY